MPPCRYLRASQNLSREGEGDNLGAYLRQLSSELAEDGIDIARGNAAGLTPEVIVE